MTDGENASELQVNFDFCDVREEDFHGLKALLTGYCDGDEYACSDLCDLLIKQSAVGTVMKTEGDSENVLGVTSVVSLSHHKGEKCVKDIKKFLLGKVPAKEKKEFENVLNDASTGLRINERIINAPQDAGQPLIDGVFEEIGYAVKDEKTAEVRKSYEFKNYILVSTLYEEDAEDEEEAGKKRKKGQPTRQRIFPRLEEELLLEHAKSAFFWRAKQNEENEIADFRPHRCCMVVEAKAIGAYRKAVKELFEDFE